MKKVSPIHILSVIALASIFTIAGILVRTRGGGGVDPQDNSGVGQFLPAILKPNALPALCKVEPLKTPDPAIKLKPDFCVVEFPRQLQVVPYCVNKATKWGGANITLPQGTTRYLNIPKNCSVLVNDEKLNAETIVCSGPAGSTVNLTVENSCTPPDAGLPAEVKPSCPPDFKVNPLGGCELQVPRNAPSCPSNTIFLASQNCCMDDKYYFTVNGINGGIRACPQGYLAYPTEVPGVEENTYEKTVGCIRESSLTANTSTRDYTITLGSCGVTDNNNTDQFSPCTINPATGICQ